ncbi:MAG: hypothetical protein EA402_03135 [Planctomycetota bacterium]|nr:MAG: hypothetical protein EA402_03135 [Planctomycetota bacterium]
MTGPQQEPHNAPRRPGEEPGHASDPHAPTVVPGRPPAPAGVDGDAPTLATGQPPPLSDAGLAATRVTVPGQAATLANTQITAVAPGARAGASLSVTGRTVRTRPNPALPVDAQTLDLKLQSSRSSVLADVSLHGFAAARLLPDEQEVVNAGDTIGRYAVQRPLAAGGMGAVLEIDDKDFRRHAAMKVIHAQHARHPQALERFLAEAQVTAQLEHPNIVPIHDLGVMDDGTLYFTMKLIEGESLGTVVKRLRASDAAALSRWSLEEKLLVFLKILDGLGFAHARGVIHRDMKPDNIMLGPYGEVLVVDWGIAKVLGSADGEDPLVQSLRQAGSVDATLQGQVMGTVHYMPPEQAAGEIDALDARSDIYSLGATLYELLALRRPVDGGSIQAILAKVMMGELRPLAEAAPELPADLVAIVAKAMALEQEQRYASCEAMADDLRRFLAGQAVAARRRNVIERFGAWVQRNRLRVAVGALMLLLLVAGISGTLWWQDQRVASRVDGLVDEMERQLTSASLESLRLADRALAEAQALRPGDGRLVGLASRISVDLAEAERARAAAEAAAASRRRASELLVQGRELLASGSNDEAAETLSAAFRLHPEDEQIEAALTQARDRQRDARLAQRAAAAREARNEGDRLLAQAQALPPTDASADALITRAEQAYALAEQDGMAPPGTADQVAVAALLRRQLAQARSAAAAESAAETARAAAETAFAAGDYERARELVTQALGHRPGDAASVALRDQVLLALRQQQAEAARAAAIAAAQERAGEQLQSAQGLAEEWRALLTQLPELERAAVELERRALDGPARTALWQAREALESAQVRAVDLQSRSEAAWQAVLSTLQEQPEHPYALSARQGLGALYLALMQQSEHEPTLEMAFRDLVQRYAPQLLPPQEGVAMLGLRGHPPSGALRLQALSRGLDGRFSPSGEARELSAPMELPAGRWRLTDAHSEISLQVEPGQQLQLYWPPPPPALPHHRLRYVPAPDLGRGFFLAEDETSHAAYYAFISDPPVFAEVAAAWRRLVAHAVDPQLRDTEAPALHRMPRLARDSLELWQPIFDDADPFTLQQLVLLPDQADLPISGITRDDAEAYCAWLAQRSGLRVRLPSLDERRHAASAGDRQRRYPWGSAFDPQAAVSVLAGHREGPAFLSETTADIGPYGHRHLAGNLREWVADRPHRDDPSARLLDAMIAGGGWSSGRSAHLNVDAYERVESTALSSVIGFRILVEISE